MRRPRHQRDALNAIRIIASVTKALAVRQVLAYLNGPTSLTSIVPVHCPPVWQMAHAGQSELHARGQSPQPAVAYEFNQRDLWRGQLDEDPISLDGYAHASGCQLDLVRPVG
jgi:hypothetical protein